MSQKIQNRESGSSGLKYLSKIIKNLALIFIN